MTGPLQTRLVMITDRKCFSINLPKSFLHKHYKRKEFHNSYVEPPTYH